MLRENKWREYTYFRIMTGMKQGYALSPLLFMLFIDYILRTWNKPGIHLDNKKLGDVDFPYDVRLLESCKQKLQ